MSSDTISIAGSTDPGFDINGIHLLLVGFAEAVDGRDPRKIAQQFTADGVFKPGAAAIKGPAAIEAFYKDRLRDPRRTTQHLWSNLRVTPSTDHQANIRVALSNYAFDPTVSETEVQLRIGHVSGACARGPDGGWRFAEHVYAAVFALRLPLSDPQAFQPKPQERP